LNKKTCVLAINMPDLEKWIQGINREGGLAKVPIWEELDVVDILQDPKDVIPSLENNSPDILFISNRFEDTESIKTVLEKCKRSYSHVRVIVLLWTKTPEQAVSAQEILHFCLHFDITTDIVYSKISMSTIKNALDNPISRKEAESHKDPNYVFSPESSKQQEEKEEPAPPKKSSLFEKIKPKLIPDNKPQEQQVSDVIPPSEEPVEVFGKTKPFESQPKPVERLDQTQNVEQLKDVGRTKPTQATEAEPDTPNKPSAKPTSAPSMGSRIHGIIGGMDAKTTVRDDFELGSPASDKSPVANVQDKQPKNRLSDIVKRTKNIVQFGGTDEKTPSHTSTSQPEPMPSKPTAFQPPFSTPVPPVAPNVQSSMPQFINAKVIAFYSPKSIGKTTVLCNMATQAANFGLRTVAIDMNVLRRDLGAYFGLPRKTVGLEQAVDDGIDEMTIQALITQKYGVDVIPIGMERARFDLSIEPAQVNQILNIVARRMDYNLIFVDTCNIIDEAATATVLMQSDIIYLIVDQNRIFLEDIYNELIFAEEVMNLPRNKFRLIINNFVEKSDMSQSRIENYLHMKAAAVIPSDRSGHLQAVNHGKPYCLIEPDASDAWSKLVFNAVGRTLETKSGMFGKIGKIFK